MKEAHALLLQNCMKRPPVHSSRLDLHSSGFVTSLEIAAGGLFTALLLRWLM